MKAVRMALQLLGWIGVVLLQIAMTQAMTFAVSLLVPWLGNDLLAHPLLFAAILVITFSAGVFLGGWLALTLRWVRFAPLYLARLGGAVIGAALPLVVALLLYRTLEPGSPFFLVSILACIIGFYAPSWRKLFPRERTLQF